jgi:hypothetical protein
MNQWHTLRKLFHGLLVCSYFSLSLSIISCFFDHDPLQPDVSAHIHHSHDQQGHQHGPSEDSSGAAGLFCKFIQNISGVALASSPLTSPALHTALHQATHEATFIFRTSEKVYLIRAPPVDFS